ncbi:MAG: flagellar motor protein [Methylococcales bacterium]|nr:flagellar motor protein [Methylococcales bacterium]
MVDILSIIGIIIAFGSILGGNALEGGHVSSLLNGPAIVIVLGGTVGAVMLQTPLLVFIRSLRITSWVFFPPKINTADFVDKIVEWSSAARKEGLLGLEAAADEEDDLFTKKGLQLLVDGSEPETIRSILQVELDSKEHFDLQAAKVFDGMGGYCPTVGILGAVMGLIHVMENLADPSKLGSGIATAFIATIYGVALANLFFLPFANKLKSVIQAQSAFREMVVEGVVAIAEGENPRNIETRLMGYVQ